MTNFGKTLTSWVGWHILITKYTYLSQSIVGVNYQIPLPLECPFVNSLTKQLCTWRLLYQMVSKTGLQMTGNFWKLNRTSAVISFSGWVQCINSKLLSSHGPHNSPSTNQPRTPTVLISQCVFQAKSKRITSRTIRIRIKFQNLLKRATWKLPKGNGLFPLLLHLLPHTILLFKHYHPLWLPRPT